MNYPKFFDEIETITLKDDLSSFLGTFEDGILTFSYLDIVKNAGHSCPTVAGAYLMALYGLKALYKDCIPKRGEIKVEFRENQLDGVAGVIANVFTHITGATKDNGFKGINNNFSRTSLLFFESDIKTNVKLTKTDTNQSIEVNYFPQEIKPEPIQAVLMQKILQNQATKEEKEQFATLWQNRVEKIFQNKDKVIKIIK